MSGKASLLVVAGFSLVFLVVAQNFGGISNRAVDNYVNYQTETFAHNIAISGANIMADSVFWDPTFIGTYSKDFQGGHLEGSVTLINAATGYREITATGTFQGKSSTIRLRIAPSSFSEYAYYSTWERGSPFGGNIWWIGGDVVNGPFHTQDDLRVYRHPQFLGDHTSHKGNLIYYESKKKDAPIITGVYEPGKSVAIPENAVKDLEPEADADGYKFSGHDTVYVTFDRDTLRYKYSYSDPYSNFALADSVPNGLIYAKDCIVRLKGTVKGQYTIACDSVSSVPGKGTIWLDDDIVYETNPISIPDSPDLLGIVAENKVLITDNWANNHDINIQASIFCENWGFGADNYKYRPVSGDINLLGGIQQNYRQPVGTFSGGGPVSGFQKHYNYDPRLKYMSPPFYPGTGGFKIVSWLE